MERLRKSQNGPLHRLATAVLGAIFKSSLYRYTLMGARPRALSFRPDPPEPGNAENADRLFRGQFHFAGITIDAPNQAPWHVSEQPEEWKAELHSFSWLADFSIHGGETARRHCRALVGSWLTYCDHYDPIVWRPDVLARRLVSWLSHADFIIAGRDDPLTTHFLASLKRQARHLKRSLPLAPAGRGRLSTLMGSVYASLCIPGLGRSSEAALKQLAREIALQIHADGGHLSRNPDMQYRVLVDLVGLRHALIKAQQEVQLALQNAIDRMSPMLRMMRHGDGGLALFNGGFENDPAAIEDLLERSGAQGRPLVSAPHTGYERLTAATSTVIFDAGEPAPAAGGCAPYAGQLSFEFSTARDRLVVNCGTAVGRGAHWDKATRATAAHSALSLGDSNTIDLDANDAPALRITVSRHETDGSTWLEADHDGYARSFGYVHRRRLYLDAMGRDFRGEDALLHGAGARAGEPFTIRFHLHPTVTASLLQDGTSAIIKTAQGEGWRFRMAGGRLSLEESVYLGRPGERKRTEQLVVTGATGDGVDSVVKWAFAKVGDGWERTSESER